MKKVAALLGAILLVSLVGCSTATPRSTAAAPAAEADPEPSYLPSTNKVKKVKSSAASSIPENAFEWMSDLVTNSVPVSWLTPPTNSFQLGPGDRLEIELLSDPTTKSLAQVGPDGKVYYSFLPGQFVWGLTLAEARELLEKELGNFMKSKPEVGLTLRTIGSRYVWIMGEVQAPGFYPLAGPVTILDAIATAGGTQTPAGVQSGVLDLKNSFIMRAGQRMQVNLHDLLAKGDLSQNVYLQPDDFVYLRSATTRHVYIMGAVPKPSVLPYQDGLTLISALSEAGGTLPYALRGKVVVVRGSLERPKAAELDYYGMISGKVKNVSLEAGDIVFVPYSPYRKVGMLLETVVQQFVRTTAVNEGYRAAVGKRDALTPNLGIAP